MKNPKNFFPSLASIAYKKNHTLSCGNSKIIDEQRLYDKLKYVTDEHVKQARFLLHVAVCNDLAYNFSKAIRDAQSVVFIEDIRGQKSEELEIALSLLATHVFGGYDIQAWAHYRLKSGGLVLRDGFKRSDERNGRAIKSRVRSNLVIFFNFRLENIGWRR
ncbi:MAG: hypothetical protein COA43_15065 [Robiginitomaculum sp.]|nr:MAG: hypothetical protein COA43_15065 [Robiginitomaculum sp.]